MSNCSITIHAVGSHHNHDHPHDINKMAAEFVDKLKAAGHSITHAHIHHGGAEDLLPDSGGPTRTGVYGALAAAAMAFVAAITLLPTPVHAADLPLAAKAPLAATQPANWNGLYVEGYGLYGVNFTSATVAVGADSFDLGNAPHGPGVGGSIGYNYQVAPNSWVLGVRVDLAYANLGGSGNLANVVSINNATNYLGDVDVCLGHPLSADGRLLAYGCGGFAFGGAKPNLQVATFAQAASDTSTGWNIGGGLTYKLDRNWMVGIEGDYFRLGDKTLNITDPTTGLLVATSANKYDIFVQKFRLAYQF